MTVDVSELVNDVQARIDKMTSSKQRRARLKTIRRHKGDWSIDVLLEAMVLQDEGRISVACAAEELVKAITSGRLPVMGRRSPDSPPEIIPPEAFQ